MHSENDPAKMLRICAEDPMWADHSEVSKSLLMRAADELLALRKDADLLAWVLAHPETAAEELEDAACGDGTSRANIEWRKAGIEAAQKAASAGGAAQMNDPERGGGAAVGIPVDRTVRPLAPVGWRYGRDVEPLYTLNHDEAAAVNKLRAQKEQARQRDLKACRCDHCEYCRHCWPEDFRPGGLWAGYGAQR